MRGRKKIMTPEQHAIAAGYLHAAYKAALHGETYSINIFGRHNVISRHAKRGVRALLLAKSCADDKYFEDNPHADVRESPYFGDSMFDILFNKDIPEFARVIDFWELRTPSINEGKND